MNFVVIHRFPFQIPGNAIYFVSFELLKPYTGTLAAGGLSGTLFWFLVLPIDTVKTRFQVESDIERWQNVSYSCGTDGYRALFPPPPLLAGSYFKRRKKGHL